MQVIPTESLAPPPPLGAGMAQGGLQGTGKPVSLFPARSILHYRLFCFQNFSGNFGFCPELFWNFQISNQKKSGRKTFAPKIFRIFNFRPENFPVFQISRQKKVRVFPSRSRVPVAGFTTVVSVSCQTDNLFSNFRANFFFLFSTFNPKFFRIFNFRAEKNWSYQLSRQKFLAGKNFKPYGQDAIGRISLQRSAASPP